jgi:hypothetical protein
MVTILAAPKLSAQLKDPPTDIGRVIVNFVPGRANLARLDMIWPRSQRFRSCFRIICGRRFSRYLAEGIKFAIGLLSKSRRRNHSSWVGHMLLWRFRWTRLTEAPTGSDQPDLRRRWGNQTAALLNFLRPGD